MAAKLNYVEVSGGDLAATKRFYADALGLAWTDYGPTYAAANSDSSGAGVAFGLQGDASEVDDVEAAVGRVEAAGGTITVPLFSFPGGRRFHFRDPAGNVLGAWQPA